MKFIIVLFKDGSYLTYPAENFKFMKKNTFQEGARFFSVAGKVTVDDLSIWSATQYNHKLFTEIKLWD